MSFLRRVFSSDYRAAVAAEAAGNVELAAERYALAGEHEGAVRMHLARAARAATRQAELAALRDALRWAGEDAGLRKIASKALGRALWENAKAEGIATERDRQKVREAAELLVAGDDHASAGGALESIGDHAAAANAYSAGGLVEKMELVLAKDDASAARAREEADAFASYQTHMRVGRRDDARTELARAIAALAATAQSGRPDHQISGSGSVGEYRRMMDQLDTSLLTAGRVELRPRGKPTIVACSAHKIVLGRDPLCDLALRAGGVSRQHAEIERSGGQFQLRDLDSRNGTIVSGLPLAGKVPLREQGRFELGDQCAIDYEVDGGVLILRLATGLDRGVALIAGDEGALLRLEPLGIGLELIFKKGRPLMSRGSCREVQFAGEPLGDLRVQLVRDDRIVADGEEIDVA